MTESDRHIGMFRAGSTAGINPPITTIHIKENIGLSIDQNTSLNEARDIYTKQGKLLAESLLSSLPGGTIDALLCELLEKKRSLFTVTF